MFVPLSDNPEKLTLSTKEIVDTSFHTAIIGSVDGDDVSIQLASNLYSLLVGDEYLTTYRGMEPVEPVSVLETNAAKVDNDCDTELEKKIKKYGKQ